MNKKVGLFLLLPAMAFGALLGCKKKGGGGDTPKSNPISIPSGASAIDDEAGEQEIFDKFLQAAQNTANYKGSFATIKTDDESGEKRTTYTGFNAQTYEGYSIRDKGDSMTAEKMCLRGNDRVCGTVYSYDSSKSEPEDQHRYVQASLDYSATQFELDFGYGFADSLNLKSMVFCHEHPEQFGQVYYALMISEMVEEMGMPDFVLASARFDYRCYVADGLYGVMLDMNLSYNVEGSAFPGMDVKMTSDMLFDDNYIRKTEDESTMTFRMGEDESMWMSESMVFSLEIAYEFDRERYDSIEVDQEAAAAASSYYYSYVTLYYDDYRLAYFQISPRDIITKSRLNEAMLDWTNGGMKVDGYYLNPEFTQPFTETNAFSYYSDIYVKCGPKEGYAEIELTYIDSYYEPRIGELSPELKDICEAIFKLEEYDIEETPYYEFVKKSEAAAYQIPYCIGRNNYRYYPICTFEGEPCRNFAVDLSGADKDHYSFTFTRNIYGIEKGNSEENAISMNREAQISEEWGVLVMDLGGFEEDDEKYFYLDYGEGEGEHYFGMEWHTFRSETTQYLLGDDVKPDLSLKRGVDFTLEVYTYIDGTKTTFGIDEPDFDRPEGFTSGRIYFKFTGLRKVSPFCYLELL